MSDVTFGCTMCGRCCHNHNLPLTLDEAIAWLEDGGKVAVLAEAVGWPGEPPPDNARAARRRRRSFAVPCGNSQIRVTIVLVAVVSGRCRNLGADHKCRIYERRPLVCRIYPAEIDPFIELRAAGKLCSPDAWQSGPTLMSDGKLVDDATRALIEQSRQADEFDALRKKRLCRLLGIGVAAVAGEGFVVHERDQELLLEALCAARAANTDEPPVETDWRMYTPSRTTADAIHGIGLVALSRQSPDDGFWFATGVSGRSPNPRAIELRWS
jgi:Fe-S-cluster containining protein